MTPDGIKKEKDVDRSQSITPHTGKRLNTTIVVMMTVVIAYLLFDKVSSPVAVDPPSTEVAAVANQPEENPEVEAKIPRESIAVLPFDNRSRLEDDVFFVEGIHDDLLTNLARIGSLKVISRTSVIQYQDTEKTIPVIAKELGVATVMEGAVQRSGNTVRINVQLIDAETDEHLWAEIYDRELTTDNLFAIQSEISESIAKALKTTLTPNEQSRLGNRPTDNLEAYAAYLRGMQFIERTTSETADRAMEQFRKAVELDPEFAPAWSGIAYAAWAQMAYGSTLYVDSLTIMEPALNRALELNDQLGSAYLLKAGIYGYRQQFEEQERAYQRAIELSPGNSLAYQWYSQFLRRKPSGYQDAYEMARKAEVLNPLSSLATLNVFYALRALGRLEEAEAKLLKLMETDPEFSPTIGTMGAIQLSKGRLDLYIHWVRKALVMDPGDEDWYLYQIHPLLSLGDEAAVLELRGVVEEMFPDHPATAVFDMWLNVYRQNIPAAMESAKWHEQQEGGHPNYQLLYALLQILAEDYPAARAAYEIGSPNHFDREKWPSVIENQDYYTCYIALVMMKTGDEAMGQELLDANIKYKETELPLYTEHAGAYEQPDCYAINGQYEQAIEALKTQVEHGHIGQYWWVEAQFPWYKPLFDLPEFLELHGRLDALHKEQYQNLKRLEKEGM